MVMNQFEIFYKHNDMNPDYTGYKLIWANDKQQALSYLLKSKPSKDGIGLLKKGGATVRITEINEISSTE